jgi:hypothetical protein
MYSTLTSWLPGTERDTTGRDSDQRGRGNVGTTQTNASGDWTFADKPTVDTRYRATATPAASKTVDVNVRPAISLSLSARTPAVGQRVGFSGRLCPEHDGTAVALQRRLPNGQWQTFRTLVLKDVPGETCSSYARTLRPRRTRAYRVHFNGRPGPRSRQQPRESRARALTDTGPGARWVPC